MPIRGIKNPPKWLDIPGIWVLRQPPIGGYPEWLRCSRALASASASAIRTKLLCPDPKAARGRVKMGQGQGQDWEPSWQSLLCKLGAASVWITRPAATWGPAGDAYWGQPEDSYPGVAWDGMGMSWGCAAKGWGRRRRRLCLGLDTWVNYLAARSHKSIFRSIFAALKLFLPSLSLTHSPLLFCRFWLRYISKRRCGRQSLRNSFPRDKQQNGKWSVAVWIAAQEA